MGFSVLALASLLLRIGHICDCRLHGDVPVLLAPLVWNCASTDSEGAPANQNDRRFANKATAENGEGAVKRIEYRYVVVATLTVVYTLNFLDRQLLAILAEPIKQDLGLSDTQIGLLTGITFALFYTTLGIPLGWLADRTNRVRMVAVACASWSAFTALCGLASSFSQLALARIGVGIGEAGGSPPSYSIIADYFPPEQRGMALSLYSLGIPLGTTAGAAIGGWIAVNYGWRHAFIFIGAAGVLISLVVPLIVREPVRGGNVQSAPQPPLWTAVRTFWAMPVLRLTALSSGFSAFVGYGIMGWMPAYLMRSKGMTLGDVAIFYSFATGAASAIGGLASGYLADRFGVHNRKAYALVPATAFVISLPFFVMSIIAPTWQISLALITVPLAGYITYLSPALAVVQNYSAADERSIRSALLLLCLNLIGLGGGPLFVGMASDWLVPYYGDAALKVALLFLSPFFVLAALLHLLTARLLKAQPFVGSMPAGSAVAGEATM